MSLRCAAFLFLRIASLTLAMTSVAFAQVTKLDPLIHYFATEKKLVPGVGVNKAVTMGEDGELYVDCFVRVYNPAEAATVAARIESLGGRPRSIIEDIMTASLPLSQVEEISSWEEVRYIEAGKPLSSKLDTSIVTTNVDDVHAGTNLGKRYDGSGVIIGIVDDTRLDWKHEDFKDPDGKTRILFVWDKGNSGSGVSEISGSSGLECTKAKIDAATCTATSGGSTDSHATHVAGITASDNSTYKGMAPGADIIDVFNVETDADSGANLSTTIVDDVRYVFAKAKSLGQPAVVNLSLGTSIGAHDDTSSMETSLNNLVKNHPGRAIVNAAGNENLNSNDTGASTYAGLHATIDVSAGTPEAHDFAVRSGTTLISKGRKVIVDVWLNSSSACTVELDGFDFGKDVLQIDMSSVVAGGTDTVTNNSGTTLKVDFTDSTNANNGKKHASATVTFSSAVSAAAMQAFSFDLIFRGTCTGDAWIWPDLNSTISFTKRFGGTDRGFGYKYVNGDSNRTITIPGTASSIIAVGSFMSRATWTDSTGTAHNQTATSGTDFTSLGATGGSLGDFSLFSSLGPTADERTKPDISAPGEAIVSSLSSGNSVSSGRKVDATHFKNEGTSMSAPHVAGIIALMFQRNHCLTSNEVKHVLTGSATSDSKTGSSLPNNTWGHGKVNAEEAMKDVTAFTGTCSTTGTGGAQTTPVTTTSGEAEGGGCIQLSSISKGSRGKFIFAIYAGYLFFLWILRLDRSRFIH